MQEDISTTEAAEVEAGGQTDVSGGGGAEDEAQSQEEVFFDATKVDPALQPSFKEMQAAWTKKVQEVAPYRRFSEFGEPDEVYDFLQNFTSQEGVLKWWFQVANQLGLTQEQLAQLLGGEAEDDVDSRENPYQQEKQPDYLTREDFIKWQQQVADQQRQTQEDFEVERTLKELGVSEEDEPFVLIAAAKQPRNLSYAERIKRGYEQVQGRYEAVVSQRAEAARQKKEKVPTNLSGGIPNEGEAPPKNFDEAMKQSKDLLQAFRRRDGE